MRGLSLPPIREDVRGGMLHLLTKMREKQDFLLTRLSSHRDKFHPKLGMKVVFMSCVSSAVIVLIKKNIVKMILTIGSHASWKRLSLSNSY